MWKLLRVTRVLLTLILFSFVLSCTFSNVSGNEAEESLSHNGASLSDQWKTAALKFAVDGIQKKIKASHEAKKVRDSLDESSDVDLNSDYIKALNDTSFDDMTAGIWTNSEEIWFINYYVTWCDSCKIIAGYWNKAAEEYSSKEVNFAAVNGEENSGLLRRFSVGHYPQFHLLYQGRLYLFPDQAPRSTAKFVEFVKSVTKEELKKFHRLPVLSKPVPRWSGLHRDPETIREHLDVFFGVPCEQPLARMLAISMLSLTVALVISCFLFWDADSLDEKHTKPKVGDLAAAEESDSVVKESKKTR